MRVIFLSMVITAFAFADNYFPLLTMMYEPSSIYHDTYFGAGSALADKSGGALLNPAATLQWHVLHRVKLGVGGGYYSHDGYQNRGGGAASFAFKEHNYIGGEYSYRNSDLSDGQSWQRGTLMYGGQLAEESNQGAVYWGINISYLGYRGDQATLVNRAHDTLDYSYRVTESYEQNMFTMDLGFYQSEVLPGLAFSFVFENLFGYQWTHATPVSVDTLGLVDTSYTYPSIGAQSTDHSWPNKEYSTILLGVALTVPLWSETAILTIPFDARFWGWLNGDLRDRSHVRSRIEYHSGFDMVVRLGQIGPRLSTRLGWAYMPDHLETYSDGDMHLYDGLMVHRVSGGFGLEYRWARIDMMLQKDGWGADFSVAF